MPTVREKILSYLGEHPEGADDDELTAILNLRYRQHANNCANQLAREGLIERRSTGGKMRSFRKGSLAPNLVHDLDRQPRPANDEVWHWEGSIQSLVARFLEAQGYSIVRLADTRRRQTGKDIEALNEAGPLWITVKGYPIGTPRTRASTQAGHWFKHALFDVIAWRGDDTTARIAVALPDFPRYRGLAARVLWLQTVVRFSMLWVTQDGNVSLEDGV